jgi:hypothetical protein
VNEKYIYFVHFIVIGRSVFSMDIVYLCDRSSLLQRTSTRVNVDYLNERLWLTKDLKILIVCHYNMRFEVSLLRATSAG